MKTMGKKHEANLQRDRIVALKSNEPNLSTSEIATRMGCAARTVTKVLSDQRKKEKRDEEEFNRFVDQVTEDFL